jgi:hypothetical protein
MSHQSVRQAARRSARGSGGSAQRTRRPGTRLEGLAVAALTALAERDAVVRDAERRVGQALLAMTDEEGLLPGHRAAAQEVGMSAPPSWESRWPNCTYVGCGTNLPPAKLSPCRKVVARWIRPAGTKEKASRR